MKRFRKTFRIMHCFRKKRNARKREGKNEGRENPEFAYICNIIYR